MNEMPTRYSELHGDMYDGLVLMTRMADGLIPVFIVPTDPFITDRESYAQWTPRPGQEVVVYGYDEDRGATMTELSGDKFHHHYNATGRLVLGERNA